ncbi:DEAD/DEAH box helicase [Liquorilactobacillus hordei]|uniref:DEAD/DEAH box helicase n=1 Tax=Liquorilactobacillus hordei TaxID=468911 RepID=UPI0039E8543E
MNNEEIKQNVLLAATVGFLDDNQAGATSELLPQLVSNQPNDTMWEHIRYELQTCRSFSFALAFITEDALTPLKVILADLAVKGISGKILTSNYLAFNQPKVFEELLKIPNITVKIVTQEGFHAKGYLFEHDDYYSMIIGSSNLTRAALLRNVEWNLHFSALKEGAVTKQIMKQFDAEWQQAVKLTNQWIEEYRYVYKDAQKTHTMIDSIDVRKKSKIVPNKMQTEALIELAKLRATNERRGLVISATGTGKTFLAALDVKQVNPNKMLFVVHREQILQKALDSFKRVLGGKDSDYGILSGNRNERQAKYLFATLQTLSKTDILNSFDPNQFDYLLIDEAHRSGSETYRRILDYFTPDFCLGMTATPERTDDFSIYQLFDYNIAYEIRLQDALKEQMLTPFHYVGLQDYEYNGKLIDDKAPLRLLVAKERIAYVLKQLEYYGYSGKQVHGLVFCSNVLESKEIALLLTKNGHPAISLDGSDSIARRNQVVAQLEHDQIEYIVTVDIFNEGIDIPCLNQVVMLRNTQSSIVFIQQLGRGLRKYAGKEFLTIIDFIGNYKNNYLIPTALTGDISRSKDNARSDLTLQPVLGLSTINFTEVARQQIYDAIQVAKLDAFATLRSDYQDLKQKLGRIPLLLDFQKYGGIDAEVFAENNQLDNYASFLYKMKEQVELTEYEDQVLSFVTKELVNGMRKHELLLLKMLLEKKVKDEDFIENLQQNNCYLDAAVMQSIEDILSLNFFDIKSGRENKAEKYGKKAIVEHSHGEYMLNSAISESLQKSNDFKNLFVDAIATGLYKATNFKSEQPFTYYQKYSRKDVCRLLNWKKDVSAPMYGYRVGTDVCPIFITYEKDDPAKNRSARYENEFFNTGLIKWYTRSPRHIDSKEVQQLLERDESDKFKVQIQLFLKKNDAEGKKFYYLGSAQVVLDSVKEQMISRGSNRPKAVVSMNLKLDEPIKYSHFINITKM